MEKRAPKVREKAKGQILVLMALLCTTLVIFFGMVVAIGAIVQAKINLQNSVDFAAMAGASWQARYLNHVALVNYRLRQNYKFILADLYVTQSHLNGGFSEVVGFDRGSGQLIKPAGTFERISSTAFVFGVCQQSFGFKPPPWSQSNQMTSATGDMCQNAVGPGKTGNRIPEFKPSPIAPINPELIRINETIELLRRDLIDVCMNSQKQNREYFDHIMAAFDQRNAFQLIQLLTVLDEFNNAFSAEPDGEIIPQSKQPHVADNAMYATFMANLIDANRVETPKLEWLSPPETRAFRYNEGGSGGVNKATLATQIQNGSTIGGAFPNYFEQQLVSFKTLVVKFEWKPGAGCVTEAEPVSYDGSSGKGAFLGLSRTRAPTVAADGSTPVLRPFSVVLRATVKPKILFWPSSLTPTLVAVGAAKPFGGRIAPPRPQVNLEASGDDSGTSISNLANMSFYPGDLKRTPELGGMGHKLILQHLTNKLPAKKATGLYKPWSGLNGYRPSAFNFSPDCVNDASFSCWVQAPTLYEGLFYQPYAFAKPLGNVVAASILKVIEGGFPSDVFLQTSENDQYFIPDGRESTLPSVNLTDRWHETATIDSGTLPTTFQINNTPVFYANSKSVQSGWSPDIPLDKMTDQSAITETSGRMGYSIKLVSVKAACEEIQQGGVNWGAMSPYCQAGDRAILH